MVTALATFMVMSLFGRLLGFGTAISGVLALAPFALSLIAVVVFRRGQVRIRVRVAARTPALLWIVLLLISVARSNRPDHVGVTGFLLVCYWTALVVLAWLITTELQSREPRVRDHAINALLLAPGVLAAVNLVLFLVGVEPPEQLYREIARARMPSWFGLDIQRVLFPLARGINSYGVTVGLGLATSLTMALSTRTGTRTRLVAVCLAGICAVVVILCDSRAAFIFGIASALGVLLARWLRLLKVARWAIPAMPLLPVAVLGALSLLASTPLGDAISRRPGDLTSATSRVIFWGAAAGDLARPRPIQMVGYGQYGQVSSGVSGTYSHLFTSYEADAELMSLHNSVLQLIFDMGYVGLASVIIILVMTWGSLVREYEEGSAAALPALALLTYVVLEGATEAIISLYFPEILLLLTFIVLMRRRPDQVSGGDGAARLRTAAR